MLLVQVFRHHKASLGNVTLPLLPVTWPLLEPGIHLTLKWYILHYPNRDYDKRCPAPAQSPGNQSAERPVLDIWPDIDLTRDLKM